MSNESLAEIVAAHPRRAELLAGIDPVALEHDWRFWARKNQLAPDGDWRTWLALAGRGFGKTEAGAQWIRERVKAGARSIALVAETQKDLEEVMVARLLRISPPDEMPKVRYKPVRISWPNGALALGYNGTEPDQLRGPEFDTAWVDELAKYRYARETWDMLQFTMRGGHDPRVFVTTTPRPIPVLREIMADPTTIITRGSTMDNAKNLPEAFMKAIVSKYEGTRLGRQELNAEMLDDVPGALWTRGMIDAKRVKEPPQLRRVVIAVDPSGTAGAGEGQGDDVGIIAAGLGVDGRGYVLEDYSCNLSPDGWARRVNEAFTAHRADRIVAERNFGGAMVEAVIKATNAKLPIKVVTASRGKIARAEPIAALYEQGRVSHVGSLPNLEDQMVAMTPSGYVGENSPDRADALVWALTELMLGPAPYDLMAAL
jgi:predicted phage terminase large subunit-like protein